MTTKRRWLMLAIEASKTESLTLPFQRGAKQSPSVFRQVRPHVARKSSAFAAR